MTTSHATLDAAVATATAVAQPTLWGRTGHWCAVAAVALSAMVGSAVQARSDVYWSVGVGAPGVVVGASNTPPAVVYPAPRVIYPAPQVVYQQPYPVVVYPPQPVYRAGWMPPGHRWDDRGRKHGHDKHDRHGDDDRHDRHDRRGHGDRGDRGDWHRR